MSFYIRTDNPKQHIICFDVEKYLTKYNFENFNSSFHLINARTLGFTYPEYLLYCKSNGAVLRGREGYSYPIFENKENANKVLEVLNSNWSAIEKQLKGE